MCELHVPYLVKRERDRFVRGFSGEADVFCRRFSSVRGGKAMGWGGGGGGQCYC